MLVFVMIILMITRQINEGEGEVPHLEQGGEGEGEGHLHFTNALVCQMVLSTCNEFVFHHTFDGGIYIQTKVRQDVRCALFPDHLEEQRVNYSELFIVVTTFTCTSYNDNLW